MIASLGMYDFGPLSLANDRLWSSIRSHLGYGPQHLSRDRDLWDIWQSPDLLFAQTCGMPFRTRLYPTVQLVGTPDYGLEDCPAGYYYSVLVARELDPRDLNAFDGAPFAYNEPLSQSGWAGPKTFVDEAGIAFGPLVQTGAHAASVRAVIEGRADWAGIDALTWTFLSRQGQTQSLRILAKTDPTPALPYITAANQDVDQISEATRQAINSLSSLDRRDLHIHDFVSIPAETYLDTVAPQPPN